MGEFGNGYVAGNLVLQRPAEAEFGTEGIVGSSGAEWLPSLRDLIAAAEAVFESDFAIIVRQRLLALERLDRKSVV